MELGTIEMDRERAMEKLASYQALDPSKRTPEDEAAMAGYKALAAGKPVVDLFEAMRDAGLGEDGMPRLAIARADTAAVRFDWVRDNWMFYSTDSATWGRAGRGRRVTLPMATFPRDRVRRHPGQLRAFLPTIPPEHRPGPTMLGQYHVLWEAVWQPASPVDPFLLRHLAGTLYVVLAQWDLTPLEQAVLRGRIMQEGTGG